MEWGEGVGGEEGEGKGMAATIGHRSSCGRWWWSWVKVVKRAKGCGGEGEGEVVGGGVKVEWGEGVGGEEGKEKVLAATEGYWGSSRGQDTLDTKPPEGSLAPKEGEDGWKG